MGHNLELKQPIILKKFPNSFYFWGVRVKNTFCPCQGYVLSRLYPVWFVSVRVMSRLCPSDLFWIFDYPSRIFWCPFWFCYVFVKQIDTKMAYTVKNTILAMRSGFYLCGIFLKYLGDFSQWVFPLIFMRFFSDCEINLI